MIKTLHLTDGITITLELSEHSDTVLYFITRNENEDDEEEILQENGSQRELKDLLLSLLANHA